MRERINSALREVVSPSLGLDLVELECTEFTNGIATIKLGPACHSCSGSMMALVQSIENELRTAVPEVEIVEAIT